MIMENATIVQDIVYVINQVGFPIAVSVFCGWYMVTTGKQMSKAMETLTASVNELVTIMKTKE